MCGGKDILKVNLYGIIYDFIKNKLIKLINEQ